MERVLIYGMSSNMGGIETYLLNLYDRIHGKQFMVDFVSDFPEIVEEDILKAKGSSVFHIPAKGKGVLAHWKSLVSILRTYPEYKTVYFNILDAGAVFTIIVPFLLRRRVVVHSHNGSTDKIRLHKFCRPILNMCTSARVACSREAGYYMFGKNGSDALVIPNAIDAAKYTFNADIRREKRKELALENKLIICHVGRLSRQKNPFFLLDIFEALHKKCPDSVLVSVGTGELEQEFNSYLRNKGLAECVKCLGMRPDVPELLQAADVFLFPSLYEGLSIAMLEAQAAGLPCVVSDTIVDSTIVTADVVKVSLKASLDIWVNKIIEASKVDRKNTYIDICTAGFDISCVNGYDEKLLKLWRGGK